MSRKSEIKKRLLQFVEEQARLGVPRFQFYKQWMNLDLWKMDDAEAQAHREAMTALENIMVNRNLRGIELEKQGRVDKAIQLYEANVTDQFDGSHPYTRLRIIYTQRKDYTNAIRVCEAYLTDMNPDARARSPFQKHLDKLKQKLNGMPTVENLSTIEQPTTHKLCPGCNTANPIEFNFCGDCGTRLD